MTLPLTKAWDSEAGLDSELTVMEACSDTRDVATSNDPKLSDGGGWRAGCTLGGKAAAEAASVTAGAVRCSAWLGDVGCGFIE